MIQKRKINSIYVSINWSDTYIELFSLACGIIISNKQYHSIQITNDTTRLHVCIHVSVIFMLVQEIIQLKLPTQGLWKSLRILLLLLLRHRHCHNLMHSIIIISDWLRFLNQQLLNI